MDSTSNFIANHEYTPEEIDRLREEYGSTYDIPKSSANYTDVYNNTHPIWSKPFFDHEHTTFNDVMSNNTATSEEIYS